MTAQRQFALQSKLFLPSLLLVTLSLVMPARMYCETDQISFKNKYIRTRFGTEQGLYNNLVDDIVQSHDGLLWVREGGSILTRFDGQHFYSFSKMGAAGPLAVAPNGDLWVGTGDELKQIRVGEPNQIDFWPVIRYRLPVGVGVTVLHFSRDGVLWMGTGRGLFRFEHEHFSTVIPGFSVERIEETANGHFWITTGNGPMEWDGVRALPHPELAAQLGLGPSDIFHVFEDDRGSTWICTRYGVARRVGSTFKKISPWGPKGHAAYRINEDSSGKIWFATEEGLAQSTATGLELVAPGMQVRRMFGDRDGNLWVSTNGDGLYRFKESAVRTYTTADGLPSNVAMTAITAHDGSVWAGFNCGGIAHFEGHGFRIYNEKDGLLNSCVWSLAEDSNHDLWVGTWGGGAFRFHEGKFTQFSKAQGLQADEVVRVKAARDGSVWFAAGRGISYMRDGQIRNYTTADGLPQARYSDLYEDQTGGIWTGSYLGAEHLVGDRFQQFSISGKATTYILGNDLAGVLYLTEQPEDSFNRPINIFRIVNNQPVLFASKLDFGLLQETKQGDFWSFTATRLFRFPPSSLGHVYLQDEPLDYETFGPSDGLPAMPVTYGSSTFTPDDKLWIATTQGLASLDLPHRTRTEQGPLIHVVGVTVSRNQQEPTPELILPTGTHHLELNFDAVEIGSPEKIRLQYRMDGVDSEWLDASPPGHAVYSTLPPGKHAFHMRSCNRIGIWDRAGTVYYITQQPYFYQTPWFMACGIALGLLVVVIVYQIRVHQAVAGANMRAEERVNERTRIARELHDTLLQDLHGLMFQFQAARNLMDRRPGDGMQSLDEAIGDTKKALAESRDAIQGLRLEPIDGRNLAEFLKLTTQDMAHARDEDREPPKFDLIEEGERRILSSTLRDEVCRIALEILRNAYRHAHAQRIEAEIRYGGEALRLRIRDDGGGIDPKVLKEGGRAGHWGLRGIRERAERIGARVDFWSETGAGTEVQIEIPSSIAYENSPDGVWSRLLRKVRSRARHS